MGRTLISLGLACLLFVGCGSDEGGEMDTSAAEGVERDLAAAANAAAPGGGMKSGAYIEYTVTGDADVSDREEEVLLCSETEDGFQAHTIGNWNFTLEADGSGAGAHNVKFTVAAPPEIEAVHDDDDRTDDRFYGPGTMTLENAGEDSFGFAAVRVRFSASDLESDTGSRISVEGSFYCGVM